MNKRELSVIERLSKKTGVDPKEISKILYELGFEGVLKSVSDYAPDKILAENLKIGIRVSRGAIDV